MTTYQYTISLNDSEYIALEKILNNAMSFQLAEEAGQPQPKQEFFSPPALGNYLYEIEGIAERCRDD